MWGGDFSPVFNLTVLVRKKKKKRGKKSQASNRKIIGACATIVLFATSRPHNNLPNPSYAAAPLSHLYISLTGMCAVTGTYACSPPGGVGSACLRHRAVQSDGCRWGPRTELPPQSLPHVGWKIKLQPSFEQRIKPPPGPLRHLLHVPPLPLM